MAKDGPTFSLTERNKVQRIFNNLLFDLKTWKVPVSGKVCPEVGFVSRTDCYAVTTLLDSGRYKVNVSDLIWKEYTNKSAALKNILAHELCHTIDGCFNHGAMWKYWVRWLNAEHGFKINPCPYSEKPTDLY